MVPDVVFKGDFDNVRFALKLARKDIGLATALAREYDVPMPWPPLASRSFEALARGWGDKDSDGAVAAAGGARRRQGARHRR